MRTSMLALTALLASGALAACDDDDNPTGNGNIPPGSAAISADITADRTFYAETTYTLATWVHVTNGATLTIQPGTRILGTINSALFILRGSRIDAQGTADRPIVFTSDQPVGSRKPGDWGGLVIVGNGELNRSGVIDLEGTGVGVGNPAIDYGETGRTPNNTDNSGRMSYVRVEFAGFGPQPNAELNSFTFAAVGSGTQLDHLQSLAGLDDSFEWFGGAVDGKYLVSFEAGDDHFDAAEGYVGRNQFLIAYQDTLLDPRAGSGNLSSDPQGFEIDNCGSATGSGCDAGYDSASLTIPMFANFTVVGPGNNPRITSTSGGIGVVLRRGAGGYYVNGVIARWPRAAISMRDPETQARATASELVVQNIDIVETGTTASTNAPLFESGSGRFTIDDVANNLVAEAGTVSAASIFAALPETAADASQLDFSLAADASARSGGTGAFTGALAAKGGTFVSGTSYRGAWDPSGAKWWQGWTAYARE
jgi:hypothetical protein